MTETSTESSTGQVLLLATDGSDPANAALAAGVGLVGVPRWPCSSPWSLPRIRA